MTSANRAAVSYRIRRVWQTLFVPFRRLRRVYAQPARRLR